MTLKKEIEDILHPNKEELHPPRAPLDGGIRIIGETSINEALEREPAMGIGLDIDKGMPLEDLFDWVAHNSSFRRIIIETIKKAVPGFEGKYHRFSKEEMDIAFTQKRAEVKQKLDVMDTIIKSSGYGPKVWANRFELMKELKEKLAQVKVK